MIEINENKVEVDFEKLRNDLLRRFRRYLSSNIPTKLLILRVPYKYQNFEDSWILECRYDSESIIINLFSIYLNHTSDKSLVMNTFKRFSNKWGLDYKLRGGVTGDFIVLEKITKDVSIVPKLFRDFIIEAEKLNSKLKGDTATGRKRL